MTKIIFEKASFTTTANKLDSLHREIQEKFVSIDAFY